MKNIRWIIASLVSLAVASAAFAEEAVEGEKRERNSLDLGRIRIESAQARDLLKSSYISVRDRKANFTPRGELPVLHLETVNEDLCRQRLVALLQAQSTNEHAEKIKERGELLIAHTGTISSWIHRGSGSYKYTNMKQSMAIRQTKIEHFKQAVQTALAYAGKHRLVELAEGEKMDILFVSTVQNALATAPDSKLVDEFLSDYYVGFGRRFKGIPVIGSKLVLRLNGNGEVVMVERNWRRITGTGERKAVISDKPLPELMLRTPRFRELYATKDLQSENITVLNAQCGFLEAPLDRVQDTLRPGCSVSFQVGKRRQETPPQLLLPLEEDISVQKLLGRRYPDLKAGR